MSAKDDESALGPLGRQEILTAIIAIILGMIPVTAAIVLILAFSNPGTTISISGDIDAGRFVDKVVESYDAFLVLLGVGVGGTTAAMIAKLKK